MSAFWASATPTPTPPGRPAPSLTVTRTDPCPARTRAAAPLLRRSASLRRPRGRVAVARLALPRAAPPRPRSPRRPDRTASSTRPGASAWLSRRSSVPRRRRDAHGCTQPAKPRGRDEMDASRGDGFVVAYPSIRRTRARRSSSWTSAQRRAIATEELAEGERVVAAHASTSKRYVSGLASGAAMTSCCRGPLPRRFTPSASSGHRVRRRAPRVGAFTPDKRLSGPRCGRASLHTLRGTAVTRRPFSWCTARRRSEQVNGDRSPRIGEDEHPVLVAAPSTPRAQPHALSFTLLVPKQANALRHRALRRRRPRPRVARRQERRLLQRRAGPRRERAHVELLQGPHALCAARRSARRDPSPGYRSRRWAARHGPARPEPGRSRECGPAGTGRRRPACGRPGR